MIRHHDRDSKSCAIGCFKGRTAEQLKHYCHTRIIIKYSFHIHTFTCRRAFRKCSFCTIWHLILVFFLHFMFIFDLWCYRREKRMLRGHLVWPLRIRMVYVRSEVVLLTFFGICISSIFYLFNLCLADTSFFLRLALFFLRLAHFSSIIYKFFSKSFEKNSSMI